MTLIRCICAHCGSDSITYDALARWSPALNDYVLVSLLDSYDCNDCGRENPELLEIEIDS